MASSIAASCVDGGPRPTLADLPEHTSSSLSMFTGKDGPPLADLSGLSSGSGRGLDQAIAAAERAVDEEDNTSKAA